MNSQIIKCFGLYDGDDRGYSVGDPIAIYPISAAAESVKNNYQNVVSIDILKIEDLNYILDKEILKDSITGKIPSFQVGIIYADYIYECGRDKTEYYLGDDNLIKLIQDNKNHNITKKYVIFDGNRYFILKSPKSFEIQKIIPSRELAIKHALSKLSKEEKDLLGL